MEREYRKVFFSFILIVFCPYFLVETTAQYKYLRVEDGLSSRRVFKSQKDTDGYMWFATNEGIDKYDGSRFTHYTLKEQALLSERVIRVFGITMDTLGMVWAYTNTGDFYCYDTDANEFIFKRKVNSLIKSGGNIQFAYFDSSNVLWSGSDVGLFYWDAASNDFIAVNEFKGKRVYSMTENETHLWVATAEGLFYINKAGTGKYTILKNDQFPSARIQELYYDTKKNQLWIGGFSNGLWIFDVETSAYEKIKIDDLNVPIMSIVEDQNNNIYIGTDGSGIYVIDKYIHHIKAVLSESSDYTGGLSGNTIYDIFQDEENRLWISTYTNGVTIYSGTPSVFKIIKHEYRNPNSLRNNHVNAILEDSDGDIWYGTNNGLSVHYKKTGEWEYFLTNESQTQSNRGPVILALCEDDNKQIWIGGFGMGVYVLNKKSKTLRHYSHSQENPNSLGTNHVYDIYMDTDSNLWFGGIFGDLSKLEIATGSFSRYPVRNIHSIVGYQDKKMLISGAGGVTLFDMTTGQHYSLMPDIDDRNFNGIVFCVYTDDDCLWLGTDRRGLIRLDLLRNQIKQYTEKDGLPSNLVYAIEKDKLGRLWISTEKGLSCFDPAIEKFTNWGKADGLEVYSFNFRSYTKTREGKLIFGSPEGAVLFTPETISKEYLPAKLVFTEFKLFDKTVTTKTKDTPLKTSIDRTNHINLSYKQNFFSFLFNSISYSQSDKILYSWIMEGLDRDWTTPSSNKIATYTNISPGTYIFKVRSFHENGSPESEERSIAIKVSPPFWNTTWAWIVYLAVAAYIIRFLYVYQRNRIERKQSQDKIRFFVNTAHDIRTPVTLIKAPLSDLEKDESLSDKSRMLLDLSIKNTERLYNLVTQLLDFQQIETLPSRLNLASYFLKEYMIEKVASFQLLALQKEIQIELKDTVAENLAVCFDKNKMDKIVDNLISNAIKYSHWKGVVTVSLHSDNRNWSLTVSDNGIGIPKEAQNMLFKRFYRAENAVNSTETGSGLGLLITKNLVTLHHGKISYFSTDKIGTTFKIVFPLETKEMKAEIPEDIIKDDIDNNSSEFEAPSSEGKPRLLLVEDNNELKTYISAGLSDKYNVITASDGKSALEKVRKTAPDIILSDIMMPVMKGDEMCRMLKSDFETCHIPVILLTALSQKENIIKGLEIGADDYISKPFDMPILKAKLDNILRNRKILKDKFLSREEDSLHLDYQNEMDQEFIDKTMAIIEQNIHDTDFSVLTICRELCISRSVFYHKLKALTGQAPNDLIRIIRMKKAFGLLKEGKYNVNEVAYQVGFPDAKYFSTAFKKYYGKSPSKIFSGE